MLMPETELAGLVLLENDQCVFSVGCREDDVRLVGGTTKMEGRVEICRRGDWLPVCHHYWNSYEARVVCRELGYSVAGRDD